MKIIYFMFCLFNICISYGQGFMPPTIEDVFDKEFSNNEKTDNVLSIITPSEILPDWFFNPSLGDHDNCKNQARIRAFCIASFMNNVSWKGISDIYAESGQHSKFEQLNHFIAAPNNDLQGLPIDSFTTKYQEQIFLYKFSHSSVLKKNCSIIDYYKTEVKHDAGYSKQEKMELFCKRDSDEIYYKYIKNNTDFEIISVFNSDTINVNPTIYQYAMRKNDKEADSLSEISLFKKGLWEGYFKSLIDNLDIAASYINTRQKSFSEADQNEKGINSFNQLNRGVYNVSFLFGISSVEFTDNEIIIHLKTSRKL
jgi:hypothetical protein